MMQFGANRVGGGHSPLVRRVLFRRPWRESGVGWWLAAVVALGFAWDGAREFFDGAVLAADEPPAKPSAPDHAADDKVVAGQGKAGHAPPAAAHEAPAGKDGGEEHGGSGDHAAGDAHGGGGHDDGGHANPVAPVLLGIVLILFAAKIGGDVFERLHMPPVLGELVVGVLLGNCALLTGWTGLDEFFHLPASPTGHDMYHPAAILKILAEIGVVILLFEVGLESTVKQMMAVGASSFVVAVLGVVAPMLLGYGASWWLAVVPEGGPTWQTHVFVGATLCATSVGITARVLKDLGRSQQRESQIILGAAVIDDVLGLVVLAVVVGVIKEGKIEFASLATICAKSLGFLVAAIVLGQAVFTRPLFRAASFLSGHGLLVTTALALCFVFSYLANLVGLAPIVGAFAAGLILESAHYRELGQRENRSLEDAIAPIGALLIPIFFVEMGAQVDLKTFGDTSVWLLAGALVVAAVIGKQVCALGILEKGRNRLAVGIGMIPRGEVGLIFAGVGKGIQVQGHPLVPASLFSALIVVVMLTTVVTPPVLKWAMLRGPQPDDLPPPDPSGPAHGHH